MVANDESRPHPNRALQQKGWREYYHVKNTAEKENIFATESFSAKNNMEIESENWDDAVTKIKTAGGLPVDRNPPASSGELGKER